MKKHEEILQKSIIEYWDYKFPKNKLNLFHVNNNAGGTEAIQITYRLKKLGVRAGVSDLVLIWDKVYFIELKAGKNNQTESQKMFEDACFNKGHQYLVIRSIDEFIDFVERNVSN